MGVQNQLQDKHTINTFSASFRIRGRHVGGVSDTQFADPSAGPTIRRLVRANTAATAARTRWDTRPHHGCVGTRATTMQSICGQTSECTRKRFFGWQSGTILPNTYGTNAWKVKIPLDRVILDHRSRKRHISTRYTSWRSITPESEWVSLKAVFRVYATKPVSHRGKDDGGFRALMRGTHLYHNVTLNVVLYRY